MNDLYCKDFEFLDKDNQTAYDTLKQSILKRSRLDLEFLQSFIEFSRTFGTTQYECIKYSHVIDKDNKTINYITFCAEYLGLSEDKIQDEFNDFLFEHTSKISLDDIMEAKKKKEEEERLENTKKIQSPYTKEYKRKIKKLPFVLAGVIFLLAIIISIVVIKTINREPAVTSELKGIEVYEYTY